MAVLKEWTKAIIGNDVFLYREAEDFFIAKFWQETFPSVNEIAGAALRGITLNPNTARPAGSLVKIYPTFLNMAGQKGIFKAGGRLGFWDSLNSISWSNIDDYADFTPDVETLAGNVTFAEVTGKISNILPMHDGFIIYATKSIVSILQDKSSSNQWMPFVLLKNSGVAYPRQSTASSDNSQHYAYTETGLYNITAKEATNVIPDVTDYLKKMQTPVYVRLLENRFLVLEMMDGTFLDAQTLWTKIDLPLTAYTFRAGQYTNETTAGQYDAASNAILNYYGSRGLSGPVPVYSYDFTVPTLDAPVYGDWDTGIPIGRFSGGGTLDGYTIVDRGSRINEALPYDRIGVTGQNAYLKMNSGVGYPDFFGPPYNNLFMNPTNPAFVPNIGDTCTGNPLDPSPFWYYGRDAIETTVPTLHYGVAQPSGFLNRGLLEGNGVPNSSLSASGPFDKGVLIDIYPGIPAKSMAEYMGANWAGSGSCAAQQLQDYAGQYAEMFYDAYRWTVKRKPLTESLVPVKGGPMSLPSAINAVDAAWETSDNNTLAQLNLMASLDFDRTVPFLAADNEDFRVNNNPLNGAEFTTERLDTENRALIVHPNTANRLGDTHPTGLYPLLASLPTGFWTARLDSSTLRSGFVMEPLAILSNGDIIKTRRSDMVTVVSQRLTVDSAKAEWQPGSILFEHTLDWAISDTILSMEANTQERQQVLIQFKGFQYTDSAGNPAYLPAPWTVPQQDLPYYKPQPPLTFPPASFLLQNGSIGALYPTMVGGYVYDTLLKKWGNMFQSYRMLLDYSPVNVSQQGIVTSERFSINGGVILTTGRVAKFDEYPVDSYIKWGKIGLFRHGVTQLANVRVHHAKPSTARIEAQTSLVGDTVDLALFDSVQYPSEPSTVTELFTSLTGAWHTVTVKGDYDIRYLEVSALPKGNR